MDVAGSCCKSIERKKSLPFVADTVSIIARPSAWTAEAGDDLNKPVKGLRRIIELRERQRTVQGRAQLRERVAVEHTLAHVGQWQGRRARYRGTRKSLFDLRRCAVVHNLHVLARSQPFQADLQDTA